jgi:hypothetical protein
VTTTGKTFKALPDAFRVLSWGCGTPSTTLGVMSAMGDLEKLDAIIHADTGWERRATIEMRDWYADWFRDHGIPVHIVSGGDVRRDGARDHINVPFWTSDGGPLRRKCTRHFKVTPAKRKLRELLGYHATRPPHPPAVSAEQWFGFTLDEIERLKDSRVKFIVNRFPLIEKRMLRSDCERYLQERGLPVPPKSACVCCPYRTSSEWLEMREESPDEWRDVCEFDDENRHNPLAERGNSTADQIYIYKHGVALNEADLESDASREKAEVNAAQIPLLCGDGPCWT